MIRSIKHEDIIRVENVLQSYLFNEEIDFSAKISEAKTILISDLRNRSKKLKWLNVPLSIPADGTSSDKDEIERSRIVVDVTALTDYATITISGSNSETSTFTDIQTIAIIELGETTFLLDKIYSYYKASFAGTITATVELVETVWELPLTYLSISLIYQALQSLVDDNYSDKAKHYYDKYVAFLESAVYGYDWNDDGDITEGEQQTTRQQWRR